MRKLMQLAINKVQKWATECGLTMSPQKINAILFTNKRKIQNVDLKLMIGTDEIEYTDQTKCLGITLDSKLNWHANINNKIKQAKISIHQLRTSISRTLGPSPEKMLWIWNMVIKPAITYASYIWATKLAKTQRTKLNRIQKSTLMELGNFKFTTPETGLDVVMGTLPLDLACLGTAIKARLRTKGMLIGMEKEPEEG